MLAWISEDSGMVLDHFRYIKIQHCSGAQRTQQRRKWSIACLHFPRKLACVEDATYHGLRLFTGKFPFATQATNAADKILLRSSEITDNIT